MKWRTVILIIVFSFNLRAYKVLFDYTKDETAGNADWVVDRDYPLPQPSNPRNERDWFGAFSAFGFEIYKYLHDTVYILHGHPITYGDPSNPMDLSKFDVFILPEPQNPLSSQEKQAIKLFVQNGGGLLMIADHNMSDRNHSGWDSPRVFNAMGSRELFGMHFNITGERPNNITEVSRKTANTDHYIFHGPRGEVYALSYHAGTGITLCPACNPTVKALFYSRRGGGNKGVMFAIAEYGRGRVAGVGDSSPIDDGTGDPHDRLYDGWNERGTTHPQLFINTIAWLEKRDDSIQHGPEFVLDGQIDTTAYQIYGDSIIKLYKGVNDSVVYVGIEYGETEDILYYLVSTNPEHLVSVPWGRGGYTYNYKFYFKMLTNGFELRDSLGRRVNEIVGLNFAYSEHVIELTYQRALLLKDTVYLLIAFFNPVSWQIDYSYLPRTDTIPEFIYFPLPITEKVTPLLIYSSQPSKTQWKSVLIRKNSRLLKEYLKLDYYNLAGRKNRGGGIIFIPSKKIKIIVLP